MPEYRVVEIDQEPDSDREDPPPILVVFEVTRDAAGEVTGLWGPEAPAGESLRALRERLADMLASASGPILRKGERIECL